MTRYSQALQAVWLEQRLHVAQTSGHKGRWHTVRALAETEDAKLLACAHIADA